jgi:hypothetical protein
MFVPNGSHPPYLQRLAATPAVTKLACPGCAPCIKRGARTASGEEIPIFAAELIRRAAAARTVPSAKGER